MNNRDRCVKGTLKELENVVVDLLNCTDGRWTHVNVIFVSLVRKQWLLKQKSDLQENHL